MSEVNLLGGTRKQQWLTAIRIYSTAIEANIAQGISDMDSSGPFACDPQESLETALKVLGDFTDEMNRLVEGVFGEER